MMVRACNLINTSHHILYILREIAAVYGAYYKNVWHYEGMINMMD